MLLGAGLLDPAVGRALTRAGLFHAIGNELTPSLWEGLTTEGRDHLEAIPILIAAAGFALSSTQLDVPVSALTYNAAGTLIAAARGLGWIVVSRNRREAIGSGNLREPVTRVAFTAGGRLIVGAGQRAGVVGIRDDEDRRGRNGRARRSPWPLRRGRASGDQRPPAHAPGVRKQRRPR